MNTCRPSIGLIIWRILKLLFKATMGIFSFVGVLVTLDSGWGGFVGHVQHSGPYGWVLRLWAAVVLIVSREPLGCVALLAFAALLTYLLVDRPKDRSRATIQAARKPRTRKRKGGKK
jgi:hypothetical protein